MKLFLNLHAFCIVFILICSILEIYGKGGSSMRRGALVVRRQKPSSNKKIGPEPSNNGRSTNTKSAIVTNLSTGSKSKTKRKGSRKNDFKSKKLTTILPQHLKTGSEMKEQERFAKI